MQTYNKKNRKETQQYLSNKKLNYQRADNNVNRMLTSVNKLLLLHKTRPIHARLHALLLTTSNFTQQIITSMKFIFEFLYSFGPTHTRKIETEMILAEFNNIYITYYLKSLLFTISSFCCFFCALQKNWKTDSRTLELTTETTATSSFCVVYAARDISANAVKSRKK